MSFANPAALWALPAAALPLLIHLLARRSARRLPFSDLTLLAAIEARSRPRSRLREALLLAARCGLLAALVLAAAGPVARGDASAAGREGLDLVLLLDSSYSMRARDGGPTRFERAKAAGRALLKRLAPADRVAFAAFDESVQALEWRGAAEAEQALARSAPGLRGTDAGPALEAASALLSRSAKERRRAVVVLGDGTGHMLRGPAPAPADGAAVLGLRFAALPNAWAASAVPARGSSARAPRLEARAAAAGREHRGALDLWVHGRRAGSASLAVPAGGEAGAVLALPPAEDALSPSWSGRAALRGDALAEDDEIWFALRHRAAPRLLVLHSDPQFYRAGRAGWYLRELFGGVDRPLAGRDADFLEASRWEEAELSRYGTVMLPDAARLPKGLGAALERFASRGGGVWIVPGARASAAELGALSAWLPARLGRIEDAGVRGLRVLRRGPETAGWEQFQLERLAFGERFRLEPGPGARVWLADGAGAPLLAEGAVGRGRAVVWAVPLDAERSNIGLKPVFVPWVQACLSLTLPPAEELGARSARVGEALVRRWRPDEPAPQSVRVRGPDGRRATLVVRERRAELPAAESPGLYEFEEPSGARMTFAVNLDRAKGESELSPLASPPWIPVDPEALAEAFVSEVYGKDRRGWVLALAALLLAAEMLLSLPLSALSLRRRSSSSLPASAVLCVLASLCSAVPSSAQQGDRFVWTQLQHGPSWDPYPDAPAQVSAWLAEVTSARVSPGRRTLSLTDPALFSSPFLYLAGREEPPPLRDEELRRLRQFLAAGGFLWIEDSTGGPPGSFDRWVRRTLAQALPESELRPLPADHVLYRTFFLLRGPSGRVRVHGAVEGVAWGNRAAILYTRDDVLGAWAKDALGRPLKSCVPGGEPQREQARRLTLNVLMYSMTGSYKADTVHQNAILDKLRSSAP